MIRVGFLLNFPLDYKGGLNYLKNLFYAVYRYCGTDIKIVLFVPANLAPEYLSMFSENAEIVKTPILMRKSPFWFLSKVCDRLFNFDPLTYYLLKKHNIKVISHSNYLFPGAEVKSINWIPDFQYLHYPHLWSKKQLDLENRLHSNWIKKSDLIVVSSNDALMDLKSKYRQYCTKVRVLHFVSQPSQDSFQNSHFQPSKYVKGPFFYMPNQFWEHKNHLVVFSAVKMLKENGINVTLVTSGLMSDFRNKNQHVEGLKRFVSENGLSSNILFLGIIPYSDVIGLMRHSVAVINPSLFEGWSSTVEESKSIGKPIILSDIAVHREQNPPLAFYFNPHEPSEVMVIMKKLLEGSDRDLTPSYPFPTLESRTRAFAEAYRSIVFESVHANVD